MELSAGDSELLRGPLARLDDYVGKAVCEGELAGASLVIARNGIIGHRLIRGWRDTEANAPLERNTIFRIASLTKPIVATAAMLLYEEGRLSLDAPVKDYLPAFSVPQVFTEEGITRPAASDIKVRQLLTHTSGLCYGGSDAYNEWIRAYSLRMGLHDRPLTLTTQQVVDAIAGLPLQFDPGTRWGYGPSTDVLGRVLEVVSGVPLDRLLSERILQPLGMLDTSFSIPQDKQSRLTPLYGVVENKIEKSSNRLVAGPVTIAPEDVCRFDLRFHMGGGGLASTIDDYLRFGMMLANRGSLHDVQLLEPSTVDLMATNAIGELRAGWSEGDGATKMGLGTMLVHDRRGPCGPLPGDYFLWFGTFGLLFWADTVRNAVCVMMSQRLPGHAEFMESCRVLTAEAMASCP